LYRSSSGTNEFQNYIDHPTPKNNEKYRANSRRNPTSGGMRVFIAEWHEVEVAKSCVYDIYLVWRVGIKKERTKSEGEGKRLLPP
jgi:hypothetical protein